MFHSCSATGKTFSLLPHARANFDVNMGRFIKVISSKFITTPQIIVFLHITLQYQLMFLRNL